MRLLFFIYTLYTSLLLLSQLIEMTSSKEDKFKNMDIKGNVIQKTSTKKRKSVNKNYKKDVRSSSDKIEKKEVTKEVVGIIKNCLEPETNLLENMEHRPNDKFYVNKCKRKLILKVTIDDFKETHQNFFINSAIDFETKEEFKLLNPYTIKISNIEVVQLFGMELEQIINGEVEEKPTDESKKNKRTISNNECKHILKNGLSVPCSQTYCFYCDDDENTPKKGNSERKKSVSSEIDNILNTLNNIDDNSYKDTSNIEPNQSNESIDLEIKNLANSINPKHFLGNFIETKKEPRKISSKFSSSLWNTENQLQGLNFNNDNLWTSTEQSQENTYSSNPYVQTTENLLSLLPFNENIQNMSDSKKINSKENLPTNFLFNKNSDNVNHNKISSLAANVDNLSSTDQSNSINTEKSIYSMRHNKIVHSKHKHSQNSKFKLNTKKETCNKKIQHTYDHEIADQLQLHKLLQLTKPNIYTNSDIHHIVQTLKHDKMKDSSKSKHILHTNIKKHVHPNHVFSIKQFKNSKPSKINPNEEKLLSIVKYEDEEYPSEDVSFVDNIRSRDANRIKVSDGDVEYPTDDILQEIERNGKHSSQIDNVSSRSDFIQELDRNKINVDSDNIGRDDLKANFVERSPKLDSQMNSCAKSKDKLTPDLEKKSHNDVQSKSKITAPKCLTYYMPSRNLNDIIESIRKRQSKVTMIPKDNHKKAIQRYTKTPLKLRVYYNIPKKNPSYHANNFPLKKFRESIPIYFIDKSSLGSRKNELSKYNVLEDKSTVILQPNHMWDTNLNPSVKANELIFRKARSPVELSKMYVGGGQFKNKRAPAATEHKRKCKSPEHINYSNPAHNLKLNRKCNNDDTDSSMIFLKRFKRMNLFNLKEKIFGRRKHLHKRKSKKSLYNDFDSSDYIDKYDKKMNNTSSKYLNNNYLEDFQNYKDYICNYEYNYDNKLHCLGFSDVWYGVYRLIKPFVEQSLNIELYENKYNDNNTRNWIELTKSNDDSPIKLGTLYRRFVNSEIPSLAFHYHPNEEYTMQQYALDSENMKLLIPEPLYDDSLEKNSLFEHGAEEFLVIPSTKVPDKEDTNYKRYSKNHFHHIQPERLWRHDKNQRESVATISLNISVKFPRIH